MEALTPLLILAGLILLPIVFLLVFLPPEKKDK